MAKAITSTTKFASRGGNPAHGLALIYDLEGFSKFFNQPDVQDYVPKFLNHVSQAVSVVLLGGTAYWDSSYQKYHAQQAPIHEKFLGDGMLYVWRLKRNQLDFDPVFIRILCNRLWNLKDAFNEVLKQLLPMFRSSTSLHEFGLVWREVQFMNSLERVGPTKNT